MFRRAAVPPSALRALRALITAAGKATQNQQATNLQNECCTNSKVLDILKRWFYSSSQPRIGTDPSVKGLNFFDPNEQTLLRTLQLGKFNIHGWRRADLLAHLHITPSAMSRQLKRLHGLGLIKKVSRTYRYYLTRMGRAAIAAACSLTRFNIVPAMAAAH